MSDALALSLALWLRGLALFFFRWWARSVDVRLDRGLREFDEAAVDCGVGGEFGMEGGGHHVAFLHEGGLVGDALGPREEEIADLKPRRLVRPGSGHA